MSEYAYVAERAKRAFASVSKLESLVQRDPKNRGAMANLSGMRRMASEASIELERLASLNHIDICQYRIVPMRQESYALKHVSSSLFQYQNLFSQLHDSFVNGPKKNATIGAEAEAASELDFAYTYSGSLGVVLLTKNERDFFDGTLDNSIDALYQVMEIDDADTVRTIADERGRAVVKRIHDWSKAHVDGGFSADIKWKRSNGRLLGQMIDNSKLENIAELIVSAADEKNDTISVTGMLVGANINAKSFHLTVPDGDTYKGHFDKEFVAPHEMTIGRLYRAKINVIDKYFYATDAHTIKNALVSLDGPLDSKDLA